MNKHNCDECKYYNWYYDHCEKWDCTVNDKGVYQCYEPHNEIRACGGKGNLKLVTWGDTTITSSSNLIYSPGNGAITISGTYWAADNMKVRKKCVYCDCMNDTEYGTCKYCGAPLGEEQNDEID